MNECQLDLFEMAIIREVCAKHNATLDQLTKPLEYSTRKKDFFWLPRIEIAYRLRKDAGMIWDKIGVILNREGDILYKGVVRYCILYGQPTVQRKYANKKTRHLWQQK